MKDKTEKKRSRLLLWSSALIMTGAIVLGVSSLPGPDMSPEAVAARAERQLEKQEARMAKYLRRCTEDRYDIAAYVTAQTAVKQRLKDPRSARFPALPPNMRVDRSDCSFRFNGTYSAKNGFGGRVRGNYAIQARRLINGDWQLLDIQIS